MAPLKSKQLLIFYCQSLIEDRVESLGSELIGPIDEKADGLSYHEDAGSQALL